LQPIHTATHYKHTSPHCNTHCNIPCNTLQHTATHCNTAEAAQVTGGNYVAVCCSSVLQRFAWVHTGKGVRCRSDVILCPSYHDILCCSVLQQCVAVIRVGTHTGNGVHRRWDVILCPSYHDICSSVLQQCVAAVCCSSPCPIMTSSVAVCCSSVLQQCVAAVCCSHPISILT